MKIWTYKSRRDFGEVGVVVKISRDYYMISSNYLFNNNKKGHKKKKLKRNWISLFCSFPYFPSNLCKPRHYLEVDQIYIHEIFRLLKKLG